MKKSNTFILDQLGIIQKIINILKDNLNLNDKETIFKNELPK